MCLPSCKKESSSDNLTCFRPSQSRYKWRSRRDRLPVGEPDSRQQRSRMAREAKKAKLQLARVQKELERRLAEEAERLQAAENECENLRSQLKEANCEAERRQRQFERENELDVLKARGKQLEPISRRSFRVNWILATS